MSVPPPPPGTPSPPDDLEPDDRIWLLLDRYLAGDAGPGEAEAVRSWLAADLTHAQMLDDVRRIREVAANRPRLRSASEIWPRVLGEQAAAQRRSPRCEARPVWPGMIGVGARDAWPRRLTAAAAVVLVAAFAAHAWRSGALRRTVGTSGHASPAAPARVYAAARGERAQLRLPDGTRVVLAAQSRLSVPAAYGDIGREVSLDGEAYFDVIHDARKPFIVRAAGALVRDIGTRFDLRAYPGDVAVRVVVTDGVVRVRSGQGGDSAGAVLGRGAAARIDATGRISLDPSVDTARYVAWTRGQLVLVATPLRAAAVELARWYNVDIQIPDTALAARRVTATIGDIPLSRVLDQLAVAFDLRVERRGLTVILSPGPLSARRR